MGRVTSNPVIPALGEDIRGQASGNDKRGPRTTACHSCGSRNPCGMIPVRSVREREGQTTQPTLDSRLRGSDGLGILVAGVEASPLPNTCRAGLRYAVQSLGQLQWH